MLVVYEHCELIIYPIDPNGDSPVFDSLFSSHNTCRASGKTEGQ